MLVIEYDVYLCKIQGDISMCMRSSVHAFLRTCDLVQALSGDMIVLIDPFSVTFKVDLGGWWRPAAQLDRSVLYNESVLWL